jgi:TATA-binding protein-associated factor Taf7
VFTVDGVQHAVYLQDLPTVVESYKTLDDANLVKVADIGQVSCVSGCFLQVMLQNPSCPLARLRCVPDMQCSWLEMSGEQ